MAHNDDAVPTNISSTPRWQVICALLSHPLSERRPVNWSIRVGRNIWPAPSSRRATRTRARFRWAARRVIRLKFVHRTHEYGRSGSIIYGISPRAMRRWWPLNIISIGSGSPKSISHRLGRTRSCCRHARTLTHSPTPDSKFTTQSFGKRYRNKFGLRPISNSHTLWIDSSNASLAKTIESLESPLSATDPDVLLLKAVSAASTHCMLQCLNLLQSHNEINCGVRVRSQSEAAF